jgi:hypothetical protein
VGATYPGLAQKNSIQSFTMASGGLNPSKSKAFEYDWRLDLGTNTIGYHPTSSIHVTSGFLQPTIYRFNELQEWKQYPPKIQLRYIQHQQAVLLYSAEPDLMIHGFQLFNSKGQLLQKNQIKTASSFLAKSIDLSAYANGVYYLLVFYLPDNMHTSSLPPYWTTTLKLLKQ